MKTTMHGKKRALGTLALALGLAAFAQNPVITSFNQNGLLTCTNLNPGSTAFVQQASVPMGQNWLNLSTNIVNPDGTIQVGIDVSRSVPKSYCRVQGVAAPPAGMALIPAGSFIMGNSIGDFDIADADLMSIDVSAFYLDVNLVNYRVWTNVYVYATYHGYRLSIRGLGKRQIIRCIPWIGMIV